MAETARYAYHALDEAGRRTRGVIAAKDRDEAFDALKAKGLSPLDIRPARQGAEARGRIGGGLSDRDIAAFISDLAALVRAGADMRTALSILGPRTARPAIAALARQLSGAIAGGAAVDAVFAAHLPGRLAFVSALVTAGTASGDLAGGFERAAEILEARLSARDQLVSILAYPAFVLASAIVALLVILLAVIPSLAPMAEAPGANPGQAMRVLLSLSELLQTHGRLIGGGLVALVVTGVAGGLLGLWAPVADRLFMEGPPRGIARSLAYGAFAVSLGGLLSAGAPMSEALRLAIETTRSGVGRRALAPVQKAVRQGERLSAALGRVRGFPPAIVRLAVIGEQSAALGPMLVRAGRFEEKAAFRRVEVGAKVLGPVLIMGLGALIGLLMAGLLTGVSGLGETAP